MDIIEQLVKEFDQTIPQEDRYLTECFKIKLEGMREMLKRKDGVFDGKDENEIQDTLKLSTQQLIKLPLEKKKQLLVKDENYEELERLSNIVFMRAGIVYFRNEAVSDDEEIVTEERVKELFERTFDFNKERAGTLLSETLLDLQVINGKRDITSIRLGWKILGNKMAEQRRKNMVNKRKQADIENGNEL